MKLNKKFTIIEKREMQDEPMTITAWANKSVCDRDKDLISSDPGTWDTTEFDENPVLLLSHDHNKPSVGRVMWTKEVPGEGGGLRFKAKFASTDTGKELYQLYKEGAMSAFSVGFAVLDGYENKDKEVVDINGKFPERVFTKAKLFEISCVNLPANASALVDRNERGELKSKQLCDIACQLKKAQIEELELQKTSENLSKIPEITETKNSETTEKLENKESKSLDSETDEKDEKEQNLGLDKTDKGISININVTDNEISGGYDEGKESETELEDEEEKVEITEEYIHVPIRDPKLFIEASFRTIDISVEKGIKAVVGRLVTNPGGGVVIQKYLFDTGKFTEGEAVNWVEGHKSFDEEIEIKLSEQPFTKDKGFEVEEAGEGFIQIDVLKEELFHKDSFRVIEVKEKNGVSALIGRLKKNDTDYLSLDVQKFYFEKESFTDEEAITWTKSHSKVIKTFNKSDAQVTDNYELPKEAKSNDFMKSICKTFKPSSEESADKTINKALDITEIPSIPADFNYDVYSKYLDVDVKDIFENDYSIPNMMLGTQLAGFKSVFDDFELKDERNFNWNGTESPIKYNTIQLTSKKSDEFLIEGTRFYQSEKGGIVASFYPTWSGMKVSLYTSKENSSLSKKILDDVDIWVEQNNHLKGEKLTISGEFLSKSEIGWDDVILSEKNKKTVKRNVDNLTEVSKSRGLLLIGNPGNGKTLSGKAIMKETDHTFIWASSDDFKDMGAVSGLSLGFKMARKLAPTVLFIEDIDTWLRDYTVDLIKTEMDGLKSNNGVVTILTSNHPEKFPDALIDRPGRFHHVLDFSNPSEIQRKEMLEKWAKGADEDKINEFVGLTDGFSGAYIKELVDYAKMLVDDEEISFGSALIKSLENILEQRKLVENIRNGNKTDDQLKTIKSSENFIDIENIEVESKTIDIESIEIPKEEIDLENIEILKEKEIDAEDFKKILEPLVNMLLLKEKPVENKINKEEINLVELIEIEAAKLTGKII